MVLPFRISKPNAEKLNERKSAYRYLRETNAIALETTVLTPSLGEIDAHLSTYREIGEYNQKI